MSVTQEPGNTPLEDGQVPVEAHSTFRKEYTEENFWEKLRRFAKVMGRELVEKALTMYYLLKDPDVPAWARATIVGSLAYLILPADVIPDIIPGAGYTDDLAVLVAALGTVAVHITPKITNQAKQKMKEWFGNEEDLK